MNFLKRLAKPHQWGFVFVGFFCLLLGTQSVAQAPLRYEIPSFGDTHVLNAEKYVMVLIYNDGDQPVKLTLPRAEFPWWGWDYAICPPPCGQSKVVAAHASEILFCKLPTRNLGRHIKTVDLKTDMPSQPTFTIEFRYEVVIAGVLEFEQENLDLGKVPVGEPLEVVFNCRNAGPGPCTIIACKGPFGIVNHSPDAIPPGGSGHVSYTTCARLGMNRKTITVMTDNADVTRVLNFQYEGVEKPFHIQAQPPAVPSQVPGNQ
jgi:hypothetical protein